MSTRYAAKHGTQIKPSSVAAYIYVTLTFAQRILFIDFQFIFISEITLEIVKCLIHDLS